MYLYFIPEMQDDHARVKLDIILMKWKSARIILFDVRFDVRYNKDKGGMIL